MFAYVDEIIPDIIYRCRCRNSSGFQYPHLNRMKFLVIWLLCAAGTSAFLWSSPFDMFLRPPSLSLTPITSVTTARPSQGCNCGWVNRGRIVGGKVVGRNEYPPVVALELISKRRVFCGGTILTPWHIITAAHCTHGVSPTDIAVRVGAHSLREGGDTRYRVSAVMEHSGYDEHAVNNDIALIVLAAPIQFNSNVGPACMPRERFNLVGHQLKALVRLCTLTLSCKSSGCGANKTASSEYTGWGYTSDQGVTSDVLREVDLRVISISECKRLWRSIAGQSGTQLPHRSMNICTHEPRKDTCQGDSGGPLIWLDPRTNRYVLVALVSYGADCGGPLPAVNTDVAAFRDWINQGIAASKPGVSTCTP